MTLHKRLINTVRALTCAVVICIGTVAVASNTMRDDSFNSYSTGAFSTTNGWTVGSGTTAVIAGTGGVGDSKTLTISDDSATAEISLAAGRSEENVWIRAYAQIRTATTNSIESGTVTNGEVAAFYVNTAGVVRATSGAGWVDAGMLSPVPAETNWVSFLVHLDYANSNFNLYVGDAEDSSTEWDLLSNGRLDFYTGSGVGSGSQFATMSVVGQTTLDEVYVGEGNLPVNPATFPKSSIDPIVPERIDYVSGRRYALRVPDHGLSAATNQMGSLLGALLKEGLEVGDNFSVFRTNGWNTFTLNASKGLDPSGTGTTGAFAPIPGETLWFSVTASTAKTNELVMFPVGYGHEAIAASTYPIGGTGTPLANLVIADTTSASAGWTTIKWTSATPRSLTSAGLSAAGVAAALLTGTQVYAIPDGQFAWREWSQWSGSAWVDPITQQANDFTIASGDTLWIRHPNATGDMTWTITQ